MRMGEPTKTPQPGVSNTLVCLMGAVESNTARKEGGAFSLIGHIDFEVTGTDITGNIAAWGGAAHCLTSIPAHIQGVNFQRNHATQAMVRAI